MSLAGPKLSPAPRVAASFSCRGGLLFLSRTRDYGSPREWYSKILRTRNSGALINTEILPDENEHSFEGARRDPFLYATSAADTRRVARTASRLSRAKLRFSYLRAVR